MTTSNVLTYFKKKIKTTNIVIRDKTILHKLIHHTQRTIGWKTWKMCQNKSKCLSIQNKIYFLIKIIDKRGESILANGWRWQRAAMVLAHAVAWVLGINTFIAQTYFTTWTNVHARHNHASGGGIGSTPIFKNLWEANACVLIMCSCNVSQSLVMYWCKHAHISWWPFSPHRHYRNDKH